MVFGVAKEIAGIRSEDERTQMLKEIRAKVVGLSRATQDTAQAARLNSVADQIEAAASRSRESNFSASDFSRSDFSPGNFRQALFRSALFEQADLSGASFRGALFKQADLSGASFRGALFKQADFRGVDLSTAVVNANTLLPKK
jgi:uncharacterized protein YjbI with pentapeptide repeats